MENTFFFLKPEENDASLNMIIGNATMREGRIRQGRECDGIPGGDEGITS